MTHDKAAWVRFALARASLFEDLILTLTLALDTSIVWIEQLFGEHEGMGSTQTLPKSFSLLSGIKL